MKKRSEDVSKEVVYSVPWQTLRVQLLARNSPKGGFDTLEGIRDNISKLKSYVSNMTDINKVYRALNLLNAARMGYASKDEINTPKDKALVKFRDDLDEAYEDLKEKGKVLTPDSSDQVAKDIKNAPVDWLIEVERDLKARKRESDPDKEHVALDNFLSVVEKEVTKHVKEEGDMKGKSSGIVAQLRKLAHHCKSAEGEYESGWYAFPDSLAVIKRGGTPEEVFAADHRIAFWCPPIDSEEVGVLIRINEPDEDFDNYWFEADRQGDDIPSPDASLMGKADGSTIQAWLKANGWDVDFSEI